MSKISQPINMLVRVVLGQDLRSARSKCSYRESRRSADGTMTLGVLVEFLDEVRERSVQEH